MLYVAEERTAGGVEYRLFHALGPATANARSPIVDRRVAGTARSVDDADHRRRREVPPTGVASSVSVTYRGAAPLRQPPQRYISTDSLYWIRCGTRSQCRSWSWSCPYWLGLVPRNQDSSRHLLKSASDLPTHQKPSWQVLDNDQSWGLWPRWIASRLYPATIPRSVATLLEVMVCACYFCTGRTYIGLLTKWHHYVTTPGANSEYFLIRNVNVAQM